jgi:hypothetical protein
MFMSSKLPRRINTLAVNITQVIKMTAYGGNNSDFIKVYSE